MDTPQRRGRQQNNLPQDYNSTVEEQTKQSKCSTRAENHNPNGQKGIQGWYKGHRENGQRKVFTNGLSTRELHIYSNNTRMLTISICFLSSLMSRNKITCIIIWWKWTATTLTLLFPQKSFATHRKVKDAFQQIVYCDQKFKLQNLTRAQLLTFYPVCCIGPPPT